MVEIMLKFRRQLIFSIFLFPSLCLFTDEEISPVPALNCSIENTTFYGMTGNTVTKTYQASITGTYFFLGGIPVYFSPDDCKLTELSLRCHRKMDEGDYSASGYNLDQTLTLHRLTGTLDVKVVALSEILGTVVSTDKGKCEA